MTIQIAPIQFEHHRSALGIGESRPRLSWVTVKAPDGWLQKGYELEQRDGHVVRVESAESVLVPWPFSPLTSRARDEVRVRVFGHGGVSNWSEWASVEAGLLSADDWSATMVGPADDTIAAPVIRGSFATTAATPIVRARVYASAHGLFQLEINGHRVGDDELAPGWTAYESRLRYTTYDVTDLLAAGDNVIGAWLADGWWRGQLGWAEKREFYGASLGVLVQLEIEYADGRRQVVGTGPDWEWDAGPLRAADIYNGEEYDARRFDPSWSTAASVGEWSPVAVREFDPGILVAPDGPPVRVVETRPVQEVLTSPSGKVILDFGQNLVGRLRIAVAGDAGTVITLRHAEVLADGELATRPLRTARATDTYTLAGDGVETWAPRFTFHGFRYAEVTGWPSAFDPAAVVAEVLHSDMERTGSFRTSNALVQRLHENVVWSMKGNFVDLPTDCPQRDERLGWTGDIQVFAPTGAFLFDTAGFLSSWLKDLAAEQRAYRGTPFVVPAKVNGYVGPTAGWADAATVVPWALYQAYGDLAVLENQFESMTAWVDEITAAAGKDRLWVAGFQFGDWLDPTAPPERPEQAQTYPEIVATAYFARSARIVADAADLLGRADDAARYGTLADEVETAFVREYVSPSGRMLSDSPTAYALALQFGLIHDPAQRQYAADRLAELVRDNGYTISTGFIGTPIITDALSANGHSDVAYRLLLQTEAPSWLYAVTRGATTIWERWDSLLPDGTINPGGMTSFNHYALGAVADWMHRVVAGLAPAAPGYRRLRIAPVPPRTGLDAASATLETPYGTASTGWVLADGQLRLEVTIPVGTTAEVHLPSGARHEIGHGAHIFQEPFEVDSTAPNVFTVDSRLGDIVDDPQAMALFTGVIAKWVPEAAEHMSGGLRGMADATPRQITGMLPDPQSVLADMERGFAALSAGEEIPVEVITPAVADPESGDLELGRLARLLTGENFWSTRSGDGIRALTLVDGPHGVRLQKAGADHLGIYASEPATCFPPGAGLASSWDTALVAEVATAIGREARSLGVDVVLGPSINIKRSPLGGRTFEYLSEDPRVAGELGAAWVTGLQSTGVGASVKHFAANNQETDRMRVSAEIDDRTLREIYLPAFERIVSHAKPATVMTAYNAINGVFASENRWLLTELLRGEWGYDGLVVSDWGAIKDRVQALYAGLDLEMPSSGEEGTSAILQAVQDGRLPRDIVTQAVARLAALAERTMPTGEIQADLNAHHALARRAGADSVVLLRNENGVLPLPAGQQVAVLGSFAVQPQYQGGGSSRVNPTRVEAPLDELRAAWGEDLITYAPGYEQDAADPEKLIDDAAHIAAASDIAIVFAGLYESEQSEGFDRTHLDLPATHVALIRKVAQVAPRTVVVLMNGGVVSLEPWHDEVDAIVEGWALGQAVGGAIADVLTGAVSPSGRLAETIPLALADTPAYLNFPGENETVRYGEGVFVGYRYYTSVDRAVRYPFGHGLSYTTFAYEDFAVDRTDADSARVRVTVRNTGERAGADVVQVYVSPATAPVRRPVTELAGFTKVNLEPGAATTVELELDRRAFAFWDVTRDAWRVVRGEYTVQLGRSVLDIVDEQILSLPGDSDRPMPLSLESTVKDWFAHPIVGPALIAGMTQGASPDEQAAIENGLDMLKMVDSMPMAQFARMPMVDIPEETLGQLIQLSLASDAAEEVQEAGV